jgi:hypothetical protein
MKKGNVKITKLNNFNWFIFHIQSTKSIGPNVSVLNLFFENWQIKMYDLIMYIWHIILNYIFIGKWLILANWHMHYLIQLSFFGDQNTVYTLSYHFPGI